MEEAGEHNMSEERPAGGAHYQEVLETGEITHNDHDEASGRGSVQDVQEALNEIIEENNQDDDELNALIEAATKELAEAKERRDRQHSEKVNMRQQLAKGQFELDKENQWLTRMERRVDEVADQFQQLDQKCDELATNHSRYADERARLQIYAQYTCRVVEVCKNEVTSLKSKFAQEIEELQQTLREEQAMTNALLNKTDDDEEYKKLEEENEKIETENREFEVKIAVELARKEEIRARNAKVQEQLAKEEEKSKQLDEMEAETKRKHQEIEEKKALLLTLQKKKEDDDRRKKEQKEQLAAAQARYNNLLQENSELKKKAEGKRKTVRKELEQAIKELVVTKHENEAKKAEMLGRKLDLEEEIRQKEAKISDIRKSKERKSRMEREIAALEQDTAFKKAKIAEAKNTLARLANAHQTSVKAQGKIKNEIEERKNMSARELLLCKDKIEMEAIEIENLAARLQEQDGNMARLLLDQNILEEVWETLANKTDVVQKLETVTTTFVQDESKFPTGVQDGMVQFEEGIWTLQKQIQADKDESSNAEKLQDFLKSQIAEQEAALEKAQAEQRSQDQKLKLLESHIESAKSKLVAKQASVKEAKQKLEKEMEKISSLTEMKESLKNELQALPNSQDGKKRIAKLEKQIKDTDQKIEATRKKIDKLNSTYEDLTKSLEEEQKTADLKTGEEEISSLKKRIAALKEETQCNRGKLEGFKKQIDGNKQRCVEKEKRTDDAKKNLEILQNEVAALKLRVEKHEQDVPKKQAERKAELEGLLAEFGELKKKAAEKTQLFRKEEKDLQEEIKKAQKHLKKLLSERSPSPETPPISCQPRQSISKGGWLLMTQSKNSVSSADGAFSLAGLTQRAPQERERSPSTESSVSSIELSKEDFKAVRSGKTTISKIIASQNRNKSPNKK